MSTVYANDAVNASNIKLEMGEDEKKEQGIRALVKRISVLLIIAVVSTLLALIFMIVMIWSISSTRGHVPAPSVGDVEAAAALRSNMDFSADPCDDFYQYACGGWMKKHVIPDDTDNWSNFNIIGDQTSVTIYNVINSLLENINDQKPAVKKMLSFYNSCMNTDTLDNDDNDDIKTTVEKILKATTKEAALEIAAELNVFAFYVAYIDPDTDDPTKNAIMANQGALGMYLKSDYNDTATDEENKKRTAYKTYLKELWMNYGKSKDEAEQIRDNMYSFESCVANKAMMNATEIRTKSEDKTNLTYSKFKEEYKSLYIKEAFTSRVSNPNLIKDDVNVYFFKEYFNSLKDNCMSELDDIIDFGNYIATRYMVSDAAYGKKSWRDIEWEYVSKAREIEVKPPKWKTCQGLVKGYMPEAVGRIFVEETFTKESKKNSEIMIKDIKAAFLEILPRLKWIDVETRGDASKKAENVKQKIGYPDWIMTDELDKYYEDVKGEEGNMLSYVVSFEKVLTRKSFDEASKRSNPDKWYMSPATVNAYYNPTGNEMVFPAAILQPPFYKETYPTYVNYGAIGVVIGHELTHGFDDNGRKYGPKGKKEKWGTPESEKKFNEAAECLVKQYGDYQIDEMNVDGKLTLGENIADNGGVKQAFLAYQHWVDRNGKEKQLPGLGVTNEQAFFLSYAQIWCQKKTKKAFENMIRADPHSPGKFRVKGPLVNSPDFVKAFACNATAPMNPKNKCEVW